MVSKHYKLHKRLKPKRSRLKKILKNRFFWVGILAFLFISAFFYAFLFSPLFEVRHVEFAGNQKIPTEELEPFVAQRIPGKLLFFQVNHLFFVDSQKMQEDMLGAFPAAEKVFVKKRLFDTVVVEVQERMEVALWCRKKSYEVEFSDAPQSKTKVTEQCFALDASGIIFEPKETDPPRLGEAGPPSGKEAESHVALFTPETKEETQLGQQVIHEELLESLLYFQREVDAFALFKTLGLRVSSLSVISPDQVNAKIQGGWQVYFNPRQSIDWQITKLRLVLDREIPAEKRTNLEYVDLRFGDQAYIKYR